MQTFVYPALLTPDEDNSGFVVTFRDLLEAITQGDSVRPDGWQSVPLSGNARGESDQGRARATARLRREGRTPSTRPASSFEAPSDRKRSGRRGTTAGRRFSDSLSRTRSISAGPGNRSARTDGGRRGSEPQEVDPEDHPGARRPARRPRLRRHPPGRRRPVVAIDKPAVLSLCSVSAFPTGRGAVW